MCVYIYTHTQCSLIFDPWFNDFFSMILFFSPFRALNVRKVCLPNIWRQWIVWTLPMCRTCFVIRVHCTRWSWLSSSQSGNKFLSSKGQNPCCSNVSLVQLNTFRKDCNMRCLSYFFHVWTLLVDKRRIEAVLYVPDPSLWNKSSLSHTRLVSEAPNLICTKFLAVF